MITSAVQQAIAEIRASFPMSKVDVAEDSQGGAIVTVHDLIFGTKIQPNTGWISFLIGLHYPKADVYPLFAPPLTIAGGGQLPQGLGLCSWRDMPATQISRRSNYAKSEFDTAAMKLAKVIEWLRGL